MIGPRSPKRAAVAAACSLAIVAGCAIRPQPIEAPEPAPAAAPFAAKPFAASVSASSGPMRCEQPAAFGGAAAYNAAAEVNLSFSPFGRPETGWALYEPQLQLSLDTPCEAATPGFAAAVASYQTQVGLPPTGALTAETFQNLKSGWQQRRPFYKLRLQGVCPDGAAPSTLVALDPADTLGGKPVFLNSEAAAALRSMTLAARTDLGAEAGLDLFAPFSGYRSPASDAERCRRQGDCQGVVRAECSAHRTGLAVDLNVGEVPGFAADSTADVNRLHQTQSPAYRWLVRNASRFGFINYVFEPWHWEWAQP